MALVPEFISVLRDIRDIKYPDIVTKHGIVVAKEALMNPHYTNIDLVGGSIAGVNTTATNIANVNLVGTDLALGVSSNTKIVATAITNVNTVGTNIAKVDTVSTNIAKVSTVSTDLDLGASSKIKTVSDAIANVNTVTTNIASVNTNATNINSINTNAANITAIQNASENASSALASKNSTAADVILTHADVVLTHADVVTCTAKAVIANKILNMTAGASTLTAGSPASASFNPTTGVMTFGIPTGPTGAKGDPFVINALGLDAGKTTYDSQPTGFSYFATDTALIYFKLSATSGNWSVGTPFGKGDTGDTGNGITSITLTGTVGSVDTYRMLFTDATFFDYTVTNSSVLDVNGRTGNVVITATDVGLANVNNTSDANKPISTATQTALDLKADATAISNIDNTSDVNKPVSTAQAIAIGLNLPKTGGTMTGAITSLREVAVAMGANNIDLATGNLFTKTITTATTLTVSNVPAAGQVGYMILQLTNGGSAAVTWFSGVKWAGGTAPTLTASGKDILSFYTIDAGTTWNCVSIQKDAK